MLKRIFQIIALLGFVVICIIAFTIPNHSYEIIPTISITSFDKPLWLCIIIGGGSLYFIILYYIYDKLNTKKIA